MPHGGGVHGGRGAEQPDGGRAVQVRNTLIFRSRSGPRLKVGQLRAILREILVIVGRPSDFVTGQQEDFAGQAVRSTLVSAVRTAVLSVRDFNLFDSALDVAVEQVQEITVQIAVNRAVF